MKIKSGFELQNFMGEHLIMAYGKQNINFNKVVHLNDSGAYLFNALLGKDFTIDDMVQLLLDEYEVEEATARADSQKVVEQWHEVGFLEY